MSSSFSFQALLSFVLLMISMIVIDYIWLAIIMSKFYLSELGALARTQNGVFSPLLWPTFFVYLFLAAGVVFFVVPSPPSASWQEVALKGLLLGLIIYGVYEMTNLALVKDWPIKMAIVDIFWGGFLCLVSSLLYKGIRVFLN